MVHVGLGKMQFVQKYIPTIRKVSHQKLLATGSCGDSMQWMCSGVCATDLHSIQWYVLQDASTLPNGVRLSKPHMSVKL